MIRSIFQASLLAVLAPTGSHAFVTPPAAPRSTALNVAIDTSDIKNGLTIELDGEPYKVGFCVIRG